MPRRPRTAPDLSADPPGEPTAPVAVLDPEAASDDAAAAPAATSTTTDSTDPTDLLMIQGRRRRAVTSLTRVLVLLLVAAAGIFAGARLEQARGTSSATLPAGFPTGGLGASGAGGLPDLSALGGALPGGGAFPGGASGSGATAFGGAGGATIGTVKLVDGNNVYIQDLSGNVTKVSTDGATITVAKPGAATDLQPGQSVTVQGAKGADGTIAATSISGTNRATGSTSAAPPTAPAGASGASGASGN